MSFSRVEIGKNTYTVEKMNPVDAIELSLKTAAIIGPPLAAGLVENAGMLSGKRKEEINGLNLKEFLAALSAALKDPALAEIYKTAYRQCRTPKNDDLGDIVEFNRWFREHPGDALELAGMAVYHLVKDFFPSSLSTNASDWLDRVGALTKASQSASKSPKDGRPGQ